ncbi:hypothetical protein F2P81_020658 [Scophthalmus maximus]|uniref:Ectonucleoside triphosphate diphosphohydrolase 6 n=1 Tax=Scophthalmus maximus TaxID=52904 RepID=A0A6A4S4E3_SCOMX|nr:hypothetical protein F2P81_020658 [Scophthalmus maximus]
MRPIRAAGCDDITTCCGSLVAPTHYEVMKRPKLAGVFLFVSCLLVYLMFVKRHYAVFSPDAASPPSHHRHAAHQDADDTSASDAGRSFQYGIMFDAGSTGTRIHVFKFQIDDNGTVQTPIQAPSLAHETFRAIKPGLSAYADDPEKLHLIKSVSLGRDSQLSCPVLIRDPGAVGGGEVQCPSVALDQDPGGPEGHGWTPPAARRQGLGAAGPGEGAVPPVPLPVRRRQRVHHGRDGRRVRVFDLRAGSSVASLYAHHLGVTSVQADDWKIVSGGGEGLVCVWEMRMGAKLWEMHNRHPVRHVRFDTSTLVTANVPDDKSPRGACITDDDLTAHRRHRGVICHYDFSEDALSQENILPICRSDYIGSHGYNYNISLTVPYDRKTLQTSPIDYIRSFQMFNNTHTVYTHSYLGLGLMSARLAVLGGVDASPQYSGSWEHADVVYTVKGQKAGEPVYEACLTKVEKVLYRKVMKASEAADVEFYAFSYYYDRAVDVGVIEDGGYIRVSDYTDAALRVCGGLSVSPQSPFLCLDLVYISVLLQELGFPPHKQFKLARTINQVETSWALGATFHYIESLKGH